MIFTSIKFLLFFPLVVLVYFLIPHKIKYLWLLITSYYFYMSLNPKYVILLIISTITTYLSGILINNADKIKDKNIKEKKKKLWLILSLILNLGILFFFKYFNFAIGNINVIFNKFNIEVINPTFNILLPVGISFYTFQALSYVIDVYRGDTKVEKNLGKYALFVSFFPQLLAGPIQKSKNILEQFNINHKFDYYRVKSGLLLMLWGFFQKLVIADRLAILVRTVYDNYQNYSGFIIIIATALFSIQIYCDFSSYSDIAIGACEVLGFKLCENFRTPYFSKSIVEFWRRWHISLGSWFRDYLYVPLGGSKNGKLKKYRNIMIVFITSGLWHGAGWNFLIWGFLHGSYEIIGIETKPAKTLIINKFKMKTDNIFYKMYEVTIVFILVSFAWIFFKANTFTQAISIIKSIFVFNPKVLIDGTLYTLGLNVKEFMVAIVSIFILIIVDLLRTNNKFKIIYSQNTLVPWVAYIGILYSILIFGVYGLGYEAQQFIYLQF